MRLWRPRLFCVLDEPQQRPAFPELARICNPVGEKRVLEYALSSDPVRRFVMYLWAPWLRFAYGGAFDRNTARYVFAPTCWPAPAALTLLPACSTHSHPGPLRSVPTAQTWGCSSVG